MTRQPPAQLASALACALALACGLALGACGSPIPQSEDGKEIFEATCAKCHGLDGKGEPSAKLRLGVPDMTDPAWQERLTDEQILETIRKGTHSGKMPGFGTTFRPEQERAIIRHVRGLR